jgi:hypothetical protein
VVVSKPEVDYSICYVIFSAENPGEVDGSVRNSILYSIYHKLIDTVR